MEGLLKKPPFRYADHIVESFALNEISVLASDQLPCLVQEGVCPYSFSLSFGSP